MAMACSSDYGDCEKDGCPYSYYGPDGSDDCHDLVKKDCEMIGQPHEALKNAKNELAGPTHYANDSDKGIIWDDQTTKDIVMELWNDGGNMIVGYKPNENYKQWLVGHVVSIDLRKPSITIVGISTGIASDWFLDRNTRLIKWTGGPTAELICTDAVESYDLGKCYYVRDGKLSNGGYMDINWRFASLKDEFLKEHFIVYRGDRGNKDTRYLNGWLICTEDNAFLKVSAGYRYRVNYGEFVDDGGDHHYGFTDSENDMDTLKFTWHFVYVPDEN